MQLRILLSRYPKATILDHRDLSSVSYDVRKDLEKDKAFPGWENMDQIRGKPFRGRDNVN